MSIACDEPSDGCILRAAQIGVGQINGAGICKREFMTRFFHQRIGSVEGVCAAAEKGQQKSQKQEETKPLFHRIRILDVCLIAPFYHAAVIRSTVCVFGCHSPPKAL